MKWLFYIVLILGVGGAGLYVGVDRPLPKGKEGPQADSLAHQMLQAINNKAWDTTRYVQWTLNNHHYLWDRQRHFVRVQWKGYRVLLNTKKGASGVVYRDSVPLHGKKAAQKLEKAWSFFCNDSFWLNAPAKVFDPGTKRQIVPLDDGGQGLLVTYTSGGVTPGDSYLWVLNEQGCPLYYRMWVSVLPIGGIKATWEQWDTLATGAIVATQHQIAFFQFSVKNLKAMNSRPSHLDKRDLFRPLTE